MPFQLHLPAGHWALAGRALTRSPLPAPALLRRFLPGPGVEEAHSGPGALGISGLQGRKVTLCRAIFLKRTQNKSPLLGQERRNRGAWGCNTWGSSPTAHPLLPSQGHLTCLPGSPGEDTVSASLLCPPGHGHPSPRGGEAVSHALQPQVQAAWDLCQEERLAQECVLPALKCSFSASFNITSRLGASSALFRPRG